MKTLFKILGAGAFLILFVSIVTWAMSPRTSAPLLDIQPWHTDSNVLLSTDSGKFFTPPNTPGFPAIIEVQRGLPVGTYMYMENLTGIDVHQGAGVTILVDSDNGGSTSMTSAEKYGVLVLRELTQDVYLESREGPPKEPVFQ